jgi:hypothetical protein
MRSVYPDSDTMARFVRDITLGAEKPDGLDLIESRAWDDLAADIAETKAKGQVIDIPGE